MLAQSATCNRNTLQPVRGEDLRRAVRGEPRVDALT